MRTLIALALLVALSLSPGCGTGSYARLVSEDDVAELAALKERTLAHTNHTTQVPTQPDNVRIAVHEIGTGARDRVIVLVHGILSDHRAWRFVAGDLAQDFDLMLVDLPGCGDSDKPDPARLGDAGYAPRKMAHRVLEAVNLRLEARAKAGHAVKHVTIVAHSLGGAVALRMFCDTECSEGHAELLSNVDGLILLSPMDVSVNKPDPAFRKLAEVSGTKIAIADATGVLESRVADATIAASSNPKWALREEADTRLLYLRDDARRRAVQAMLIQAVPWKDERPDWDSIGAVEDAYCRVDVPTLILWGRRDETLPVAMGYKLAAELPRARLVCLPGVMHSPHIETPLECARMIREFVENPGGEGAALDSAHGTRPAVAGNP